MTPHEAASYLKAPFGWLKLQAIDSQLVGIELQSPAEYSGVETILNIPAVSVAVDQFRDYFEDPAKRFSIPTSIHGTPFQKRVWLELSRIPYGVTVTYGQLATNVGTAGIRAVASACKANPFPIIIPCHRVVSARGLGGYCGQMAGPMLEIKRWLLLHEGYLP